MYIGGREVKTADSRPVRLPYDGSEVGVIYEATKDQVDAAVAAATSAAPLMREMTLDERSTILRKAHQKLLDQREPMALAVSSETGKPIKEARLEVDRSAMTLLFSSEEAHRLRGEVVPMDASPAGKGPLGHDRPRAAGRDRRHHAVQFSAESGHAQDRTGARRRQCRGAQARLGDPAVGHPHGPHFRGMRTAGRRAQRDHRTGRRDRRHAGLRSSASPW